MSVAETLRAAVAAGTPAALVTVVEARGSTPREAGVTMTVTATDIAGTIGGGRLEYDAIERARALLASGEDSAAIDVPLGPDIGQCCGGRVRLAIRRADAALMATMLADEETRRLARPAVLIFGAGHTGRALAAALALLPLNVRLIDSRPGTLEGVPDAVTAVAAALPEAEIADAPAGAAYLVMTHAHSLDFMLTAAALARGDAAYVGMIGSATKRERFRRQLEAEGRGPDIARLTLPIGGPALRDKRPEVIAALTAAEILTCLLSDQQEKLTDRFAGAASQCNSHPARSTG
ncbi:xanthine dehydrogenase accessory protein XdhC [Aurantimonas endophytica]|uniref:Xanthine dehydrogenase accessory protein XdhC n=1 Tax=Aurantimonas endophytica TaxID=1522175 RepID=A0A7W6HDM3_9HYPH|nr:xanthine dehydrogenase accessory protein XdhC [Aurantimonas endophytica]MBB4003299.1 xanthine dehydrogenase accessory protein XdhC [Aurantimonas endophytica]MCO6404160.1 xanthine dehydrogenase accessory protein XdhC [Aurantimonas endophytica]